MKYAETMQLLPVRYFELGRLFATPGALEAMQAANVFPITLVSRHVSKDWGDLCQEDKDTNEAALRVGLRLFSSYIIADGVKIWVITESDRSSTTMLLPSEY